MSETHLSEFYECQFLQQPLYMYLHTKPLKYSCYGGGSVSFIKEIIAQKGGVT